MVLVQPLPFCIAIGADRLRIELAAADVWDTALSTEAGVWPAGSIGMNGKPEGASAMLGTRASAAETAPRGRTAYNYCLCASMERWRLIYRARLLFNSSTAWPRHRSSLIPI
jgi:hypothetical protein